MNPTEIAARIEKIFEEEFEVEPARLKPEAQLFQDLGLDSLDIVEMMVALQKAFGIQMRDSEEARAIRTLNDLYTFVQNEMQKAAAPSDSAQ